MRGADGRLLGLVAVSLLCLVMGWFAFVEGARVPLLGAFDFGIHELGHMLTAIVGLPHTVVLIMGNGTQTLVPLILAAVFIGRGDGAGAGFCICWAGTTLQDASVYIDDADTQALPIIGTAHDWATVLGPAHLDVIEHDDTIAMVVRYAGLAVWVLGAVILAAAILGHLRNPPVEREVLEPRDLLPGITAPTRGLSPLDVRPHGDRWWDGGSRGGVHGQGARSVGDARGGRPPGR